MSIHPVILCGGSGTRLWPLSRKSYPKQFVELIGDLSLFQQTAQRLTGGDFAAPLVLTNDDFRFVVTEQLARCHIDPGAVMIEPEGRDTAPAVLAAALYLQKSDPDGMMLVAPSDHVLPDVAAFHAAVDSAKTAAKAGRLVTFGITPQAPESGYGYLELAQSAQAGAVAPLKRFVEKPALAEAERMLAAGNFLWNAGIFLFAVRDIVAAFRTHAPELLDPVQAAVDGAQTDLGRIRLAPDPWARIAPISIDYAVMERADNLSVVPYAGQWSDLGSWEAVWRESAPDGDGLATFGPVTAIECKNSLLRSESDKLELVGIGLDNIVAVAMPDAVLIADASRSQDVKQAVEALKRKKVPQATELPVDYRPWGWYESYVKGPRFQVKRIVVNPGASLSLQSHHHRSEHWIVVEGTAKVTVDDTVRLVSENESVYVPLGAVHRMENPGKLPMVLIEVQTGSYLGEDDIVRYEDIYARD